MFRNSEEGGTINKEEECSFFGVVVCVCDVSDCFKTKGCIFGDDNVNEFIGD